MRVTWFGYPDLKPCGWNGALWEVEQLPGKPWGCVVNGVKIVPYTGFKTDFASIPTWAQSVAGGPIGEYKGANYAFAAVIHDLLYSHKGIPDQHGDKTLYKVTRKTADKVFYHAMLSHNVDKWRAKLMYCAVRVGGGRHYGNYKRLSKLRGYDV